MFCCLNCSTILAEVYSYSLRCGFCNAVVLLDTVCVLTDYCESLEYLSVAVHRVVNLFACNEEILLSCDELTECCNLAVDVACYGVRSHNDNCCIAECIVCLTIKLNFVFTVLIDISVCLDVKESVAYCVNLCEVCISNLCGNEVYAGCISNISYFNNGLAVCIVLRSTYNGIYSVKELVDYNILSVHAGSVLCLSFPPKLFSVCENLDLSACVVCYGDVCCDFAGVNVSSCEVNSYCADFPPSLILVGTVGCLQVVGVNSNSCICCCVFEYLRAVVELCEAVACCECFFCELFNCCNVYVIEEDIGLVCIPAVLNGSCSCSVYIVTLVIPNRGEYRVVSIEGVNLSIYSYVRR